jgi:hypothetical protein
VKAWATALLLASALWILLGKEKCPIEPSLEDCRQGHTELFLSLYLRRLRIPTIRCVRDYEQSRNGDDGEENNQKNAFPRRC